MPKEMVNDKEMEKALWTIKKGCKERRCEVCRISCYCDDIFKDGDSPCNWDLEEEIE